MLDQKITNILSQPIPDNATKKLPGKGGNKFTTINGYYVIERLNEALGVGGWRWDVEVVVLNDFEVVVKGTLTPNGGQPITQFGSHRNEVYQNDFDSVDPRTVNKGDLCKGATTNALSKCASYLGIGAEIYGQKYKGTPPASNTPQHQPSNTSNAPTNGVKMDDKGRIEKDVTTAEQLEYSINLAVKENGGKPVKIWGYKIYTKKYAFLCRGKMSDEARKHKNVIG